MPFLSLGLRASTGCSFTGCYLRTCATPGQLVGGKSCSQLPYCPVDCKPSADIDESVLDHPSQGDLPADSRCAYKPSRGQQSLARWAESLKPFVWGALLHSTCSM